MSDKKYPYVNHMNILYDALKLVDVPHWSKNVLTNGTTKRYAK